MHRMKSLLVKMSYIHRQIIAVALAVLGTFVGIFFGSVSIHNTLFFDTAFPSDVILEETLGEKSLSLWEMTQLYHQSGEFFLALFPFLLVLFSVTSLIFSIYGVKKGNKYYPMAVAVMGFAHVIFSLVYVWMINGESQVSLVGFHFSRVIGMIFSFLSSGFWFFACDALDLYDSPQHSHLPEEPESSWEKVVFYCQEKISKVKSIRKCGRCGKFGLAKGEFCSGCGFSIKEKSNGCQGCGATLAPGAQFCPKCGTHTEARK